MSDAWPWLVVGSALACAASGGAFLVFSIFTSTALARLPAAQGMAAMQQINLAAPRSPAFMGLVFGPGLLLAVLATRSLVDRPDGSSLALLLSGAGVYILGVIVMTAVFHVPRNNSLATMDAPTRADDFFADWLRAWVVANHVRTVSGLLAGVLVALSLR